MLVKMTLKSDGRYAVVTIQEEQLEMLKTMAEKAEIEVEVLENRYWFVAQTYVNLTGATVSYFAFQDGPYGMHTTPDINDENICYFTTEDSAKHFAYGGLANTDRTVHGRYLSEKPKRIFA